MILERLAPTNDLRFQEVIPPSMVKVQHPSVCIWKQTVSVLGALDERVRCSPSDSRKMATSCAQLEGKRIGVRG
jgi:hypothetical protein